MAYDATSLRHNEFRVLEVYAGSWNDHISCKLHRTSFPSPALYEAISYRWGGATTTIQCGDKKDFQITENLDTLIRRLRHAKHSRVIWVDAICINQTNNDEKSQQVELMFQIYRHAISVIIWLGKEADSSDVVMDEMSKLNSNDMIKEWLGALESGSAKSFGYSWVVDSIDSSLLANPGFVRILSQFWSRPWFRRVWVQQEAVACSNVSVLCGSKEVSWDSLFALAWLVSRRDFAGLSHVSIPTICYSSIGAIELLQRWKRGIFTDLWKVLDFSSVLGATDPRDRLYAFLGIAELRDPSFPLWRPAVNYNATSAEVFTDFAVRFLERQDQKILNLGGRWKQVGEKHRNTSGIDGHNKLPSWSPHLGVVEDADNRLPNTGFWNATPDTSFSCRVTIHQETEKIFVTHGHCLAKISCASGVMEKWWRNSRGEYYAENEKQFELVKECYERASELSMKCSKYPDSASRLEAFWRTLITNQSAYQISAPGSFIDEFKAWERWLSEGLSGIQVGRYPAFGERMEYAQTFYSMQFCQLDDGDMCLAPVEAQQGDHVGLILGLPHPWVMRSHGHFYELIGECYVHGAMHGERLSINRNTSSARLQNQFVPKHNYVIAKAPSSPLCTKIPSSSSSVETSLQSQEGAHSASKLLWTDVRRFEQENHVFGEVEEEILGDTPVQFEHLNDWRIGWLQDPNTGAHWTGYHHKRLGIYTFGDPAKSSISTGPIPSGWRAGRHLMRDIGAGCGVYFVHEKSGTTTLDDPCLSIDLLPTFDDLLCFI